MDIEKELEKSSSPIVIGYSFKEALKVYDNDTHTKEFVIEDFETVTIPQAPGYYKVRKEDDIHHYYFERSK